MKKVDGTTLTMAAVGLLAAAGALGRRGSPAKGPVKPTAGFGVLRRRTQLHKMKKGDLWKLAIRHGLIKGDPQMDREDRRNWTKSDIIEMIVREEARLERGGKPWGAAGWPWEHSGSKAIMHTYSVALNRGASEELSVEVQASGTREAGEKALEKYRAGDYDHADWDCETTEYGGDDPFLGGGRVVDVTRVGVHAFGLG